MDEVTRQIRHEEQSYLARYGSNRKMPPEEPSSSRSPSPVVSEASTEFTAQTNSLPRSTLEALQASLSSGRYSDLRIIHGRQSWSVHKVIVCTQSPVLASMVDDLPAEVFTLNLSQFDFHAVSSIISYFYTTTYPISATPPTFSLPLHIRVFSLSCALQITPLSVLSRNLFHTTLKDCISNVEVYYTAVRDVYRLTTAENPALRIYVVDAAIQELELIMGEPEVRRGFMEVADEVKEFRDDIWLRNVQIARRNREHDEIEGVIGRCKGCAGGEEVEYTIECLICGKTVLAEMPFITP